MCWSANLSSDRRGCQPFGGIDLSLKQRLDGLKNDPVKYQYVVLSNTTLGSFMAFLNTSILIIALPAIFRGIGLAPLAPGNVGYLLWTLVGFQVASAVLVVTFGRLGDIVGRVRLYNLGFLVFTVAAIALAFVPGKGGAGAIQIVILRVIQGVGGAFIFANSTAILTDVFPSNRRGAALGINQVAGLAGAFIGLIVGGVLADINWRFVFWISVPFGLIGTVWAYFMLKDESPRLKAKVDLTGGVLFALSLVLILIAITYGVQPHGAQTMSWGSTPVLGELGLGLLLLIVFFVYESKTNHPMLNPKLFLNRAFSAGALSNLLASIGRGGLQFMLILWLQGIWLPLHGYRFDQTPLWAGIYMVPLTVGFLVSGPLSGYLSDRFGARYFSTLGMIVASVSFVSLVLLPVNFAYPFFAMIIFLNGVGFGLFAAPNTSAVMSSVKPTDRGAASGVMATFTNTGQVLSIGIFFSLMITGLASTLPQSLYSGLLSNGVPGSVALRLSHVPPVASIFAAFLGFNPLKLLIGPSAHSIAPAKLVHIYGQKFFPSLISAPFKHGLVIAFSVAVALCVIAAVISWLRGGGRPVHMDQTVTMPDEIQIEPTGVQ